MNQRGESDLSEALGCLAFIVVVVIGLFVLQHFDQIMNCFGHC